MEKMNGSSRKEKIAKALMVTLAVAPMAEVPMPAEAQTIQRTYDDNTPNIYRSPNGEVYQESHGRGSPNVAKESPNGHVRQESHGHNSPNIIGGKGSVTINNGDVTFTNK